MSWSNVHYKKLTVPAAWVECDYCYRGKVIDTSQPDCKNECPLCNGDGGKWHEALECRSSHH